VLQLAGDPVAVQQARAGRKLERAEKEQIKSQLRGAQTALHGTIHSMGGRVLGNYQSAYNGIKVRVPVDKVAQLASMPGVLAVRPVWPIKQDNVHGVPLIGAPAVWQNLGLHGEGIKVAIIDTGIDYTHANFGGPGTAAAYQAALATDTAPADPNLFGPHAPRVKGGIDLVGDDYNADPKSAGYQPVPHPDPNPLDCNGHGSHVAGTAAGSGVTADGATYTGPYNANTISGNAWTVGPGVAPKADIYSVRVFGCQGSTDVVVDAIDWAVDNDMDVINMSLGSDFGSKDSPDAEATTNAASAGVVVVVSAGNAGPNPYIVGSPGTADGAVTVAASDPTATFPGATLALSTGGAPLAVQNSNAATFADGTSLAVVVLRDSTGAVSLGCDPAEYIAAGVAGKLVVTQRGTCARVARAVYAQQAGAAAAALIDNTTGYPPFEGQITSNPDTGEQYTVTIPFFGVRGLAGTDTTDGGRLRLADGGTAVATNAPLPNPNYLGLASFSSSGPRTGDSALKPNLTAPGVGIVSTGFGTGNGSETLSGTSMAAPHVTGSAALTRQAHPNWQVPQLMSALINTGDPAQVAGYRVRRAGTGLVQPAKAAADRVTAQVGDDDAQFSFALNFGLQEVNHDVNQHKTIRLRNNGSRAASFNVAQARAAGSPHTIVLDRTSVTVPAHGGAEVGVTLNVPIATAGASNQGGLSFHEVAGLIEFTPSSALDNGGAVVRVPYYLVPRALSGISTSIGSLSNRNPSTVAKVTNRNGAISGDADFYAWGLSGIRDPNHVSNVVRAVGTQSFDWDGTNQLLVFAVNTFDHWSNASTNEFDIGVDVDGDGVDDYIVVGIDQGLVSTGSFSGNMATYVFSTRSAGASLNFLASAPTDSSTAELALLTSQLCRTGEPCASAANPRITYHATGFDLINGGVDAVPGTASYNIWSSAISQGGFATVAPGGSDTSNVIAVNPTEWALTPAKGLMIVSFDNKSGENEAQLIDVRLRH
jgi:subtilisin family serine protease